MTRLIFLLLLATLPLSATAELAGSRPNIILVLTDDQGYGDLACHGHPFVQTPHLDAFHAKCQRI